jgi:hypothetical protein
MNFFENALCDLIDLEENLGSDWVDVANGDLPQQAVTERIHELREIIEEFKKIHVGLVKQDRLMNELAEIQL